MDFLGSPLWGGIGVFIAVIAIILTLVQIRAARVRKLFAYNVVSNACIATINEEVEKRVSILLDGKPVEDCRIVVIEILNGGDVPIQATDYENGDPIVFDFGTGAEVLNVDVLETKPSNIKPSLSFKSGEISLNPLLLNRQDSITFKALLTKSKGEVDVQGRISGVKEIITFDGLPQHIMKKRLNKLGIFIFILMFIINIFTVIWYSIFQKM